MIILLMLKCDSEGNKFVDMELLEVPKNLDISKLQPLVVEDSLESIRTINGKEKEVVVPMGTYVFDRTIGKYGGYRIPLNKHEKNIILIFLISLVLNSCQISGLNFGLFAFIKATEN